MATAGSHSPFMGSVSAGTTATGQDLFTLLSAVWSDLPVNAAWVQVQLDPGAGSAALYIGNSNVASNMCGASLVGSQATVFDGHGSNNIALKDIFLRASTGTVQVNLIVKVR